MFRFFFHELPDFDALFIEFSALLFDFCARHHDLYLMQLQESDVARF